MERTEMKKLTLWAITLLMGASLAIAQNTGGDKTALNPQPLPPGKKAATAETKTKTSHKGGKKATKGKKASKGVPTEESKKGSGSTTTPPLK
jgi:hypothetical protein